MVLLTLIILTAAGVSGPTKGPVASLEELDRQIAEVRGRLQELDQRLGELEAAVSDASRALEGERERWRRLADATRGYIRARLILSHRSKADLLAFDGTVRDLVRREAVLTWVARREARLMRQSEVTLHRLQEARAKLQSLEAEVGSTRDALEERLRELEGMQERRGREVSALKVDPDTAARASAELSASRARLASVASRPPTDATELTPPPRRLPWPVDGRLILNFGAKISPDFGTKTKHDGVDILTALGAEVHAAHPGRVAFVGPIPGYGLVVILAHGQGYHTVYARLQRTSVKAGDMVALGQAVGAVGPGLLDDSPRLHFEIRRGGVPQDPRVWLARPKVLAAPGEPR